MRYINNNKNITINENIYYFLLIKKIIFEIKLINLSYI